MASDRKTRDTVEDFGIQWTRYPKNPGYYASPEALRDLLTPLLEPLSIKGKRVADVGAGSGRYTRLLHKAGARSILAMEPSKAFEVLKDNTADLEGITYLQERAENIPTQGFDLIFCIGVLPFLQDPMAALNAMGRALGPKGKLFLWVYGKEGNAPYLLFVRLFRLLTPKLPAAFLDAVVRCLLPISNAYASISARVPWVPLAMYVRHYYSRLDPYSRRMVIFDQLHPRFARYYRGEEVKSLLVSCNFKRIQMHHRLNYSWSVLASYGDPDRP